MRNFLTTPHALRRTGSTPGVVAARIGSTPGAFTLVEILVALAVMVVMLSIILVPLNMGLSVFHIGKARSEVQQANQLVLNQLASELKRAIFVFPNEEMPGITNKAPYSSNANKPYYDTVAGGTAVSNTARLDFLLPATTGGATLTPLHASNYIVTYYARRLDNTKPYDVFSNPVVLFRAQYPYREDPTGTRYGTPPDYLDKPDYLARLDNTRYPVTASPRNQWLGQSFGEPNIKPSTSALYFFDHSTNVADAASNTQITPRDMALVVDPVRANLLDTDPNKSLQPDSSFVCDDANNDSKIDRVTISLLMQKYDSLGAANDKSQQIRSTQSVALPNIR